MRKTTKDGKLLEMTPKVQSAAYGIVIEVTVDGEVKGSARLTKERVQDFAGYVRIGSTGYALTDEELATLEQEIDEVPLPERKATERTTCYTPAEDYQHNSVVAQSYEPLYDLHPMDPARERIA